MGRREQLRIPFQWGMDGGLQHASVELGLPEYYLENYLKNQTNYKDELKPKSPIEIDGSICNPVNEKGDSLPKPKNIMIYFKNEDLGDIKMIVAEYPKNRMMICTNTSARHRVGHVKRERQFHQMFLPLDLSKEQTLVPCCMHWRKDVKDGDTMTNSEMWFQNNEYAQDKGAAAAAAADENNNPNGGASAWDAVGSTDDNNGGASAWDAVGTADGDKPAAAAAGGAVLGDITNAQTATEWNMDGASW